jgi:flagellar hook-length control protein FliK
MARRKAPSLADDIRASLQEALALASGKRTNAKVHRVTPRERCRAMSKQMAS